MAIEPTDELLKLQRAADEAGRAAKAHGCTPEAWQAWRNAAAAVQAAVTEHAAANGLNRYEVEAELKKQVRHPAEG